MKHNKLSAIVAVDERWAIGSRGALLCHLPGDMSHFRKVTTGHSIVMGRRTFESFPKGPLPDRQNIVVTRQSDYAPVGVTVAHSLPEAIASASCPGEVFVIGGAQVYEAAIPLVNTLYLTIIHHTFEDADAFFPAINPDEWEVLRVERHKADEKNKYAFTIKKLRRK